MSQKIYELKFNGKVEVEESIEPDTEYSICCKRIQNQEGKVSKRIDKFDREVITYTMVNLDTVELIAEDKVIKGKAKGSMSQAMRFKIHELHDIAYSGGIEKEAFYQKKMAKFMKEIQDEIDVY